MTLAARQWIVQLFSGLFRVHDQEFLKPTLTGIGVSVGVLAALTLVLVALAGPVPDDDTTGDARANSERSEDEDIVAVNPGDAGDNANSSGKEDSPGELNTDPIEITESSTAPNEAPPVQTTSTRKQTKPLRKEALAPFTIASLPMAPAGNDQGSQGSGRGFSDIEERLNQAGAKSGDVQISLAWNNVNDLDLHVVTPVGDRISFIAKRSSCDGELDVDMNAGGSSSNKPVENVFWPTGQAPRGEFIVIVHHYSNHGGADPTRYQVIVKVDGKARKFSGAVTFGDRQEIVHRFTRR